MLNGHDGLGRKGLTSAEPSGIGGLHTSLISQKSTSSFEIPAFSRALGMAKAGPTLTVSTHCHNLVAYSPHDLWWDTNNSARNIFTQDRETKLLRHRSSSQQNGSGSIGYLRSVTGMCGTVLGESRLKLGKRLFGDTGTNTIIGIDDNLLLLLCLWVDPFDLESVAF